MQALRIGFIGGGNMAEALIAALVRAGHRPESIWVSDISEERTGMLHRQYGVHAAGGNAEVAAEADVLVLAVKPQQMKAALAGLAASIRQDTTVISIAAGVSVDSLKQMLGKAGLAIVRMEQNGLKPENGPVIVDGATGGVGSIAVDALARLGYQVVALTGKAGEADYLKTIGASEVKLRSELDLSRIRPLDKATWAGAVDNLGGETLAWMASTMKVGGCIASIGLAAGTSLNTTVLPFILRGVSLLGVDSVNCPMPLRQEVWRRLAGDMRPAHLKEITRTIPFAELPSVFDKFIGAQIRGRVVVDLNA